MATPDKPPKDQIAKTVLWNLMRPRKHADEGKRARDFVGMIPQTTPAQAGQSILEHQNRAIEQATAERNLGHRTFPTATAVGYATPMMSGAEEINRQTQRDTLAKARPFFRDPSSGHVLPRDQWSTENAAPFVYTQPSGNPAWAIGDKSLWPENIQAPEGKPLGGVGTLSGLTEGYEEGARQRVHARRDADIKANPGKYFLRNLLGLRGTQTTDFEKRK